MKSSIPSTSTILASSLILAMGSMVFVRLVYAPAEEARTMTVTTLSSSANPADTGHDITLTASVHLHGIPVRTGIVRFYDETNHWPLGTADVASPSIAVSGLSPGVRAIRADYSGVLRHGENIARPSSSALLRLDVLMSPQVVLAVSRDTGGHGQLMTVAARVTGKSDQPGGNVTFKAGNRIIATQMLDGGGRATFVTSALDESSDVITAYYHGDRAFAPAAASVELNGGGRAGLRAPR